MGFLGFRVDQEARFDETAPLYMQVSRDGLVLHLSEHYGDGSPGAHFHVEIEDVRELHAELAAKNYGYLRPGLVNDSHWGTVQLCLIDPFGNKLDLGERKQKNDPVA